MCGITGFAERQHDREKARAIVKGMADLISYRGPDGEGYFIDDRVALGHRRLSIIDLEGGKQPMFNEDGSLVVIFNGEIWCGTDGGGIFTLKDGEVRRQFSTADGLVGNVVFKILENEPGDYWITTGTGISRLNTKDGERFVVLCQYLACFWSRHQVGFFILLHRSLIFFQVHSRV